MNKTNDMFNWIWPKVKSALSGKVDKEKGKGLSTNDYTTADKTKVENITTISNEQINKLFERSDLNGFS